MPNLAKTPFLLLVFALLLVGCDSSSAKSKNESPSAFFDFSPSLAVVNEEIRFTEASSDTDGEVVEYTWGFGDGGEEASGPSAIHSFKEAGTYEVTLTVTDDDGTTASKTRTVKVVENTYQNPVLNKNFPDPAVLKAPDGWYYAYSTNTTREGRTINMQVARSQDLVEWQYLGDAMPQEPSWASQDFWAPHVIYDEEREKYFLYFSGEHKGSGTGKCIGVATSDSPGGPFREASDQPMTCGEEFSEIDPMAFDDPETGKQLLFWGSGFEPIKVRELASDRIHFKERSEVKTLVEPGQDEDYSILVEGAWVVYRDGRYYLFYSGDKCCDPNANYAVMAARAENATGPYERFGEANGTGSSVILEEKDVWRAPGHNSVITDSAGQDWMLYHAYHPNGENATEKVEAEAVEGRVMLLDRIFYRNGWPRVENYRPSYTSESAPVVAD